jgi:hypothetical protein
VTLKTIAQYMMEAKMCVLTIPSFRGGPMRSRRFFLFLVASLLGVSGASHRAAAQHPAEQPTPVRLGCPKAKTPEIHAHLQTLLDTLLTPPPKIYQWYGALLALGSPEPRNVHLLTDSADTQLCMRITARLDSAGKSAYSAMNPRYNNVLYYRVGRSDTTFIISEPQPRPKPKRALEEWGPVPVVIVLEKEVKLFRM